MQEIYRVLARLMPTDLTVMIYGESGTGKELVARALHDYGKRRRGTFVAVNMAAIPRELIESELFRSEEHTSELQSLMRISYAVFCLKKRKNQKPKYSANIKRYG